MPAKELGNFVRSLAHWIAKFPADGLVAIEDRVNAIALAPVTRDAQMDLAGLLGGLADD